VVVLRRFDRRILTKSGLQVKFDAVFVGLIFRKAIDLIGHRQVAKKSNLGKKRTRSKSSGESKVSLLNKIGQIINSRGHYSQPSP
jgi:hypothetical protein